MYKIGIIGERDSVLGYMAIGFAVHEAADAAAADVSCAVWRRTIPTPSSSSWRTMPPSWRRRLQPIGTDLCRLS